MNSMRNIEIRAIHQMAREHIIKEFEAALADTTNTSETLYMFAATLYEIESDILQILKRPTEIHLNLLVQNFQKTSAPQ